MHWLVPPLVVRACIWLLSWRGLANTRRTAMAWVCARAGLASGSGSSSGGLALTPLQQWGRVWDSGAWWMLLAAQSMAVGTVMVPWVSRKADNIMATGYHMLLGGLPLAALAFAREADMLSERLPQLTGGLCHGKSSMFADRKHTYCGQWVQLPPGALGAYCEAWTMRAVSSTVSVAAFKIHLLLPLPAWLL